MVNFSHQAPLTYLKDRVTLINRFVYNHPEESSQLVSIRIQIPITNNEMFILIHIMSFLMHLKFDTIKLIARTHHIKPSGYVTILFVIEQKQT